MARFCQFLAVFPVTPSLPTEKIALWPLNTALFTSGVSGERKKNQNYPLERVT